MRTCWLIGAVAAGVLHGCSCGPGSEVPLDAGTVTPDAGGGAGGDGGASCPTPSGEMCFDGWCWLNPWPLGTTLNGVWGSSPDRYWAVGERGLWLRWDGCEWTRMPSATLPDGGAFFGSEYGGVVGFGADDLWAVGEDHLDHNRTIVLEGAGGTRLWGASPSALWLADRFGTLKRFDGATVVDEPNAPPMPEDIWGAGGDVWVASLQGGVWRREGAGNWVQRIQTPGSAMGVWGTGPSDVWAVGDAIYHWDGTSTRSWDNPAGGGLNDVWVGSGVALAVGDRGMIVRGGDGGWTALDGGAQPVLLDVHGTRANDAWAVGLGGALVHWNGTSAMPYSRSLLPPPPQTPWVPGQLTGLWASGPDDVWLLTPGLVLRYDGSDWKEMLRRDNHAFSQVWGTSPTDVWVVGSTSPNLNGFILHWDGQEWTETYQGGAGDYLTGIWGAAPGELWAVGAQRILRHRDGGWESDPGPLWGYVGVWGVSADHVWVAGSGGVHEFSDGGWTNVLPLGTSGSSALYSVRGSSEHDVWAVGAGGIHHTVDGGWVTIDDRNQTANDVLPNGDGTAWVAGFWNGWERATPLKLLDGRAPDAGGVRYFDIGTQGSLRSFWRMPDGTIWVIGENGAILTRKP
jgi:hypothetical protein